MPLQFAKAPKVLDLSQIPEDVDWIVGHTNDGLTIHAQVGPEITAFADTPQEALDEAVAKFKAFLKIQKG